MQIFSQPRENFALTITVLLRNEKLNDIKKFLTPGILIICWLHSDENKNKKTGKDFLTGNWEKDGIL